MKVLIAGGGTGGHLFSGVAVAKELLKENDKHEITFVGTNKGIEARVIPQEGFKLRLITVAGLKRVGLFKTLLGLIKLPLAALQSFWIVLSSWPDVAIGVGGYASGPLMLAAWFLRRPCIIIEQNSYAGVTNKILGKFVKYVITHFSASQRFFAAEKIRQFGNPVRPEIVERARKIEYTRSEPERLNILITGGSQGAHAVNETVKQALPLFEDFAEKIKIRHQCGVADESGLQKAYQDSKIEGQATAFIDDMLSAYDEADLIICRAGASTIAEISIAGKPALFIPLPTAADDHQTMNAKELAEAKGAWLVKQSDFTPQYLADFVKERIANPAELEAFAKLSKTFGRPDAAKDVVNLMHEMCGK